MPITKELLEDIASDSISEDYLDLSYHELTDDDVISLAKALETNSKIKNLNLRGNKIEELGVKALALLKLSGLDLSENLVTPIGAQYLVDSPVTELYLSGNPLLGDEGAINLSKGRFRSLSLGSCGIGNKGALAIFSNPLFEELDLSVNNFDHDGMKSITQAKKLSKIDLSYNEIGSEGAQFLAANTSIKIVTLDACSIEDRGAAFLASSTSIEELDLSENLIGEKGFLALCTSRSIKKLSLLSNDVCFTEDKPLPDNKVLVELNLSSNKIKDIPTLPLKSIPDAFPSLTKLKIDSNEFTQKGVVIFSDFQMRNPKLKELAAGKGTSEAQELFVDLSELNKLFTYSPPRI